MGNVTEDMLTLAMAVADGEASPADERRLAAAVAGNPELAASYETFKATGRRLGRVFDEVMAAPVPEHLVRTVMTAPIGKPASLMQAGNSVASATGVVARWRALLTTWEVPGLVLAASALAFLAGGALLGSGATATGGSAGTQVASLAAPLASASLSEALGKVAAGAEQTLDTKAGPLSVRVVETFRDAGGTPCREFEAQAATGPRQFGVACHVGSSWQLKAVFEGPARTGATVTAGPGAFGELLDDVTSRLRQGEALSVEDEKALIAAGWAAK
jgi:anti-sigma factor RsiW